MIPSFEAFQRTQKLKKYTFSEPAVTTQYGYYRMTQKATGPRGGETHAMRSFYGMANAGRCAEILRSQLEAAVLRKLKK